MSNSGQPSQEKSSKLAREQKQHVPPQIPQSFINQIHILDMKFNQLHDQVKIEESSIDKLLTLLNTKTKEYNSKLLLLSQKKNYDVDDDDDDFDNL